MLVTRDNFLEVVEKLMVPRKLGVDTETTGLHAYKSDRLFSIIIGDEQEAFYFNFIPYPKLDPPAVLQDEHKALLQKMLFSSTDHYWFAHNAKFDMAMLANEGIEFAGTVHCTYALARVLRGDLFQYSLDALCERYFKLKKSDAVMDYMDKHKLYVKTKAPGAKRERKNYFFHKVPIEIMQEYAELDTKLCYKLGMFQLDGFTKLDAARPPGCPSLQNLIETELALTKILFDMERRGIPIDADYCRKALAHYDPILEGSAAEFKRLTGHPLVDSAITYKKVFPDFKAPKTDAGRDSWADSTLALVDHPAAKIVQNYREAGKLANTYFRNYLDFMDDNNVIHPNWRQAGTKTGRFSCSDPNLQNLPTEDTNAFSVKKAFKPPTGYCFFMPDYDQMEYRLMLDLAEEHNVISKVLSGLDVHTATGQVMGVDRQRAKTINFKLIYGGGIKSLADDLGITFDEAKNLRAKYFADLPAVGVFTKRVENALYSRGYLFNWRGRRYIIPLDYAYRAVNALIQGGSADAVRLCMVDCARLLEDKKSYMVMQVHDQLVFALHETELDLALPLQGLMEKAYPSKHLPLSCSPSYSWKNLHDTIDGYPTTEGREDVKKAGEKVT